MKLLITLSLIFSGVAYAGTETCRVTTQKDAVATPTSTQQLSELRSRKCLVFQNQSASVVYIRFTSAHSGTENFQLAGGAQWNPIIIPVNAVFMKSAAGAPTVTIIEGQ